MASRATAPGPVSQPTAELRRQGRAAPAESGISDRNLVLIVLAVTVPILWMGYGTDIDVTDVIATADGIRRGDYMPSRTPGVPVFEGIAAVLDPIGGHVLLNLATALAAAATVVGLARLVRAWGHDNGDLIALAFFAAPVTIVASTSVADFIWALAFAVWGALCQLRGREVVAGVLFGLAIGSRLSTVLLVAAFLVADGWEPAHWRRCLRSGSLAVMLGAALYVPSWLAFDQSWRFLDTEQGYRSFTNNLGRFVYKNYATAGALFLVAMLVALPALVRAVRRWPVDPMVRFGVLGFAVSQALFFLMPWKAAHLLPCLATLLVWLGASTRNRRPFLWLVIGALVVNGLVAFRPLAPDDPGDATTGRWDPSFSAGLLLNDIRCRLDAMSEPLQPLNGEAWPCTLEPMRGAAEPE
jgi:hypothetical protein